MLRKILSSWKKISEKTHHVWACIISYLWWRNELKFFLSLIMHYSNHNCAYYLWNYIARSPWDTEIFTRIKFLNILDLYRIFFPPKIIRFKEKNVRSQKLIRLLVIKLCTYSTGQLKGPQIVLALIFYSEEIFAQIFSVRILKHCKFWWWKFFRISSL